VPVREYNANRRRECQERRRQHRWPNSRRPIENRRNANGISFDNRNRFGSGRGVLGSHVRLRRRWVEQVGGGGRVLKYQQTGMRFARERKSKVKTRKSKRVINNFCFRCGAEDVGVTAARCWGCGAMSLRFKLSIQVAAQAARRRNLRRIQKSQKHTSHRKKIGPSATKRS
jgi:hypothetical protein